MVWVRFVKATLKLSLEGEDIKRRNSIYDKWDMENNKNLIYRKELRHGNLLYRSRRPLQQYRIGD
jgi:hypothetical protein